MSVKAIAYVKELKVAPNGEAIERSEKLLLFVLADCHNADRRVAWPSVKELASDSLMSLRAAQYVLKELERKGVIHCTHSDTGRGHFKGYAFSVLDGKKDANSAPINKDVIGFGKAVEEAVETSHDGVERVQVDALKDADSSTEGCKKGANSSSVIRKEPRTVKPNTKPSASDEAADHRHVQIRTGWQKHYSEANEVELSLVPWTARDGAALKKFLEDHPKHTVEYVLRCAKNYFGSAQNISQFFFRIAPKLLEFHIGAVNEFKTPFKFTEESLRRQRMGRY